MKEEVFVISLGGSLICPESIDISFLKDFRNLILENIKKGRKFLIITGGGKIGRFYLNSIKEIVDPTNTDLDWIGIASTRLNAEFLRVLFAENAYEKIILDPDNIPQIEKSVVVGGGWKPGNSSDLASIHAAISIGSKKVINLSNIDCVYDKDPKKDADAVKIENISWADLISILPQEWKPGLNSPFDPIAARYAKEKNIEVAIMNGNNLENLQNYFDGKEFLGTSIK
jgi:uridylate kinase